MLPNDCVIADLKGLLLKSSFVIFLFCGIHGASAQPANRDSLKLANRISADKEKLAKWKGDLPDAEKAKKETADKAQESADDNRKAANKLSNDPQNKKLARRADRDASDA